MRDVCPNYHILTCLQNIKSGKNYAISDVRFQNEGKAILDKKGVCVKISGTTTLSGDNKKHASETEMASWDGWLFEIINNKEGFDVLYRKVDELLKFLPAGKKFSNHKVVL